MCASGILPKSFKFGLMKRFNIPVSVSVCPWVRLISSYRKSLGSVHSWGIYTDPKEYGRADSMTEALHDARNALAL